MSGSEQAKVIQSLTFPTAMVLGVLYHQNESQELHGLEISRRSGQRPSTVYQILERLEKRGIAYSWAETLPPGNRPQRRYWRLTPEGMEAAKAAMTALRALASEGGE